MADADLEIHLIADSTGESCVRMARAAVAQFPGREFKLVRHRRITNTTRLMEALDAVKTRVGRPTAVIYTLVDGELAAIVEQACRELEMPFADLMTDSLRALEAISGARADAQPLRPVGVETDYFTRIAAIDFAVRNDDGAHPPTLREADIVLVGASRSGKTPLSIFLGYLGYKVANVPLVPPIQPPEELFGVDRWRLVGLTMDPERLKTIRDQRVRGLGVRGMKDGYVDLAHIAAELDEIGLVQRRLGCPVLDTTGLALEEAAARIVDLVDERARKLGGRLKRPPGIVSNLSAV